jgi:Transglycosylase SLT domain
MIEQVKNLRIGGVQVSRWKWKPFFLKIGRLILRMLGIEKISWRDGVQLTFIGALGWGCLLLVPVFGLAIGTVWVARSASHTQTEGELLRAEIRQSQRHLGELKRLVMLNMAIRHLGGARIPDAEAAEIVNVIDHNARLYGFDPFLILAVVSVESRGKTDAVGHYRSGEISGATGMMQIMPATARLVAPQLGVKVKSREDLFDPALNLAVGTAILLKMIHRYGDLRLGIMAYNVGPNALEAALHGQGNLPTSYYAKVMVAYRQIRKRAEAPQ